MLPCEEKFIEALYTKAGVNHGPRHEKKEALNRFAEEHLAADTGGATETLETIIEALGKALGSLKENDGLVVTKTFINKALTAAHKLAPAANKIPPLSPEEQDMVNGVYARFDAVNGTAKQKNAVLQKYIGTRSFHCSGAAEMSEAAFEAMELRANERVYLLLNAS